MDITSKSLISILLLVIALVAGYFLLMPSWQDLSASSAELAVVQEENKKLSDQRQQLEQFLQTYQNSSKARISTMDYALPLKGAKVESVLADLDTLAASSGIVLTDVSLVDKSGIDNKAPTPFSVDAQEVILKASGSFPSFRNFLVILESNLRLIDISSISFDVDDAGISEYNMKFKVYYQN